MNQVCCIKIFGKKVGGLKAHPEATSSVNFKILREIMKYKIQKSFQRQN